MAPKDVRAQTAAVTIDGDDIGGVVTAPNGPEAGVWVIAETNDLPTKFAKIVVTDDQGRYVIPDLPKAKYTVWVRGYGLVDSPKVKAHPGKHLEPDRGAGADAAAAAEYYPGMYWYSLLKIPAESEFPGTGPKRQRHPDQHQDPGANGSTPSRTRCQSCHPIGNKGDAHDLPSTRPVQELASRHGSAASSRVRRGQHGDSIGRIGPTRRSNCSPTGPTASPAGELPVRQAAASAGHRAQRRASRCGTGRRRKAYLHDAISTDKRNPTVNANGPDLRRRPRRAPTIVPVLDPMTNETSTIKHALSRPADALVSRPTPLGPSPYWGDEPIWDSQTTHPQLRCSTRRAACGSPRACAGPREPGLLQAGSIIRPRSCSRSTVSARQLSMYDPKTGKWSLIDTCFSTQHLNFAHDANNTLWTSAGGPHSGVVGWLNTKMYLETGDDEEIAGLDAVHPRHQRQRQARRVRRSRTSRSIRPRTSGSWRPSTAFSPSPVDGSIWGQSMDVGLLAHRSARLRRPPDTGLESVSRPPLAESYVPPDNGYWLARHGHRQQRRRLDGALERTHRQLRSPQMQGPLNGPAAATGKQCPGRLDALSVPGSAVQGRRRNRAARTTPITSGSIDSTRSASARTCRSRPANGGEALLALVDGKFVTLRVPYPMGFFAKNVDGRIDDPNAGWKGKGIWTTIGTRAPFHNEGGSELAEGLQGADASEPARQLSGRQWTARVSRARKQGRPATDIRRGPFLL